jgi:hypothetical protein
MHQYYLKVVPTTYVYGLTKNGREEVSHQFSVTRTEKDIVAGASGIPGIFFQVTHISCLMQFTCSILTARKFQYEFSPLMVRYEERKSSLSHFLVNLCAIIGMLVYFCICSLNFS